MTEGSDLRRTKILRWIGGCVLLAFLWWTVGPHRPWWVGLLLVSCLIAILLSSPSKGRSLTAPQIADLIERFLDGTSLYPQEWNDFVERSQRDKEMDRFRKRCSELDPLVNHPGKPDPKAVAELRSMVEMLRSQTYPARSDESADLDSAAGPPAPGGSEPR
jgi:hypothetical protein